MEFLQELFLTGFLSLIFAFLLAKLVSMASAGDADESESVLRPGKEFDGGVVTEERTFEGRLNNPGLQTEDKVEFIGETVKIDQHERELVREKMEMVHGSKEFEMGSSREVEVYEDNHLRVEEETLKQEVEVRGLPQDKLIEERSDKEEMTNHAFYSGQLKEEMAPTEDDQLEANLVEESHGKLENHKNNIELAKDDDILFKDQQLGLAGHELYQENAAEVAERSRQNDDKEVLFSDEDDWEGIERTEVEKLFSAAAAFVGSPCNNDRLSNVDSDVQMLLYGLHKVATEGPCHEPQPMALKVSARAKWNAWQQLGNMSPEEAMDQYITLLSDTVPGWKGESPGGHNKQEYLEGRTPGLGAFPLKLGSEGNQRNPSLVAKGMRLQTETLWTGITTQSNLIR
ncbi:PREDICTED: acyl-CoA-binding domain-containing protein 3-like isoform X2 [Nelumbo nucifera]|uniref:Acyl-CoA-binding domain-containing protein 3-like isoform X2 n=1 Tax=Nelumbo nucifera TaxID=4432 RepID=A0A1U8BBE9_NELNU|nr:PREDICTED: acyl-CoA-binding domain-containing protein 3-like isoform X2 [Nelumbo nucifera]